MSFTGHTLRREAGHGLCPAGTLRLLDVIQWMAVPLALSRSGWPDDQGADRDSWETYWQGFPGSSTVMAAQDSASVSPGIDIVWIIEVPVHSDDHVVVGSWWPDLLPRAASRGGAVELRLLPPGIAGDTQQNQVRLIGCGADV